MAVFTSTLPTLTGNTKKDIIELRSWAFRLVNELGMMFCALDERNVKRAASVKASNLLGTIDEKNLPDISVSKLYGQADMVDVNGENGIILSVSDGGAEIYIETQGDKKGLHINADSVYINGTEIA